MGAGPGALELGEGLRRAPGELPLSSPSISNESCSSQPCRTGWGCCGEGATCFGRGADAQLHQCKIQHFTLVLQELWMRQQVAA